MVLMTYTSGRFIDIDINHTDTVYWNDSVLYEINLQLFDDLDMRDIKLYSPKILASTSKKNIRICLLLRSFEKQL